MNASAGTLTRHAEQLEALARRPLQPRREALLAVAARLRALKALRATEQLRFEGDRRAAA
jgi:hypothetical protein